MIQIQSFTFPSDAASGLIGASSPPAQAGTPFAALLGSTSGNSAAPLAGAAMTAQTTLFAPQQNLGEALALVTGSPAASVLALGADSEMPVAQAAGETEAMPVEMPQNEGKSTDLAKPASFSLQAKVEVAAPQAEAGEAGTTVEPAPTAGAQPDAENDAPEAGDTDGPAEPVATEAASLESGNKFSRAELPAEAITPDARFAPTAPTAKPEVAPSSSDDAAASAETSAPSERQRTAGRVAHAGPSQSLETPHSPSTPATTGGQNFAAQVDGNSVNLTPAMSAGHTSPFDAGLVDRIERPAAAAAHSPAPGTISGRPGEIGRQLGVEIARHSVEGRDSLTIRLDPAELGRIHIRMHFDDGGNLRAQVSAESGMALDMLRRDSGDLARALGDAGVRTDAQSFQFDGRGQQREQQAQRNQPDWARSPGDPAAEFEQDIQPLQRKLNPNGALDLFA